MEDFNPKDIIDFRCELYAIRQKFGPRYYCERQAAQEAARLWGVHCNEHGVLDQITEDIRVEHQRYSATIRLYKTEQGYWHVSHGFSAPGSGFAVPATVWNETAFTNELAARRWAVDRLLRRCDARLDAELRAFRDRLAMELTPQLALF